MRYCENCKINILDNTDRCLFCNCVTSTLSDEAAIGKMLPPTVGSYPDAVLRVRKYRFLGNLILFISIVIALLCIVLNVSLTPDIAWSAIVILLLIYGNTILQYAIMGRNSYRQKTIILTFLAIAICIGIDAATGYRGWSVNIIFPGAIVFLDVAILVVMIINWRNWQSYMMVQLMTICFSAVGLILVLVNIITWPYMVYIALASSSLLFLGTFILGDRRARSELHRRFHF